MHTGLHMWSANTQTRTQIHAHTQRSVISLCGCRLWGCRGQWGGIGISAVFGVLQLISLDFSETAAHPDLIQSLSFPLPPSNCFCLFINSTRYLQRSRRRAAKPSQRGGRSGVVARVRTVRLQTWQEREGVLFCFSACHPLVLSLTLCVSRASAFASGILIRLVFELWTDSEPPTLAEVPLRQLSCNLSEISLATRLSVARRPPK